MLNKVLRCALLCVITADFHLIDLLRWRVASWLVLKRCDLLERAMQLYDRRCYNYRGLQVVWLFEMFEPTPALLQLFFLPVITSD